MQVCLYVCILCVCARVSLCSRSCHVLLPPRLARLSTLRWLHARGQDCDGRQHRAVRHGLGRTQRRLARAGACACCSLRRGPRQRLELHPLPSGRVRMERRPHARHCRSPGPAWCSAARPPHSAHQHSSAAPHSTATARVAGQRYVVVLKCQPVGYNGDAGTDGDGHPHTFLLSRP